MERKTLKKLYKVANCFCDHFTKINNAHNLNFYFLKLKEQFDYLEDKIYKSRESIDVIKKVYEYKNIDNDNSNITNVKMNYTSRELSNITEKLKLNYEKITSLLSSCETDLQKNKKLGIRRLFVEDVFKELVCLKEEFGDNFGFDEQKKLIFAITDNIILKDTNGISYDFGPFKIKLFFDKNYDEKCYRIEALKPLPYRRNSSYTHPHVSCNFLCEGDAAEAITISLQEGRLTDFFDIIKSVLNTYNETSPFAPLEVWIDGENCCECDCALDEDETYYCDCCGSSYHYCNDCMCYCECCHNYMCSEHRTSCNDCNDTICSDCSIECNECGNSYCGNCIEECRCGRKVCKECRETCGECGEVICYRCYKRCSNCEEIFCIDCLNKCICEEMVCKECSKPCDNCGDIICIDCLNNCDECNGEVCKHCLKECSECNKAICKECANKCNACSDIFCDDHAIFCSKCGNCNCKECNTLCHRCGENLCESCSCDCENKKEISNEHPESIA